jgi:hypothetical protein
MLLSHKKQKKVKYFLFFKNKNEMNKIFFYSLLFFYKEDETEQNYKERRLAYFGLPLLFQADNGYNIYILYSKIIFFDNILFLF